MARNYTVTEIDGVKYELHPVKYNGQPAGFVPVRVIKTLDDIKSMMSTHQIDEETACKDFTYGLTVRLQRMAREIAGGEKFTQAIFNKRFNLLPVETLMQYQKDFDGLFELVKQQWLDEQSTDESDEKHVFEELL